MWKVSLFKYLHRIKYNAHVKNCFIILLKLQNEISILHYFQPNVSVFKHTHTHTYNLFIKDALYFSSWIFYLNLTLRIIYILYHGKITYCPILFRTNGSLVLKLLNWVMFSCFHEFIFWVGCLGCIRNIQNYILGLFVFFCKKRKNNIRQNRKPKSIAKPQDITVHKSTNPVTSTIQHF